MKPEQPTIGRILRGLRAHHGWTLKQMSAKSGIPLSTLSKVEHDRLTLSYDKLQLLSQRLNMTMSELFAEPGDTPEVAVTARRSIGRIDHAVRVTTPNYDYYYLCPELRRKRMIPVLAHARAKTLEEFGELVAHPGEEFVYVVDGRAILHTEFYDPIVLETGDSVYFDSNMGHAYLVGEGCDEAVLLCTCSSADEALMESLLNLHGKNDAQASMIAAGTDHARHTRRAKGAPPTSSR
ncbi:MAG: helix-turn-helix domain-containing protein [Chthoniobacterales bacterium]